LASAPEQPVASPPGPPAGGAEAAPEPHAPTPAEAGPVDAPGPSRRTWRGVWQAPTLLASVALLGAGVWLAVARSPEPDFGSMLDAAGGLVEKEKFERALDVLNTNIRPYLDHKAFTIEQRQRFHTLRARAIFEGQAALGLDRRENHESIIAEYLGAESLGAILEVEDSDRLAHTFISAGMYAQALERARAWPQEEQGRTGGVVRRIVEYKLEESPLDFDGTLGLVSDYAAGPMLSADERAWAEARQAELLLLKGYHDDAIRKLLRGMPRAADAGHRVRGELHVLLGRAYLEAGSLTEAGGQFARALELLPEGDAMRAGVGVLLGRIDESNGNFQAARDRYAEIIVEFGDTDAALTARLGLADAESAMQNDEAALEVYAAVVDAVRDDPLAPGVTKERVTESLMGRFEDRFVAGDSTTALKYASLAADLFGLDSTPPEVTLALGRANRRLAEQTIEDVRGGGIDLEALADLDPATREVARRYFLAAGEGFRRHAGMVVLGDSEAYAESLWLAADSFDRAGDLEEAVAAFVEYTQGFAEDPRQAEARFRLAQAHQARGDYGLAAQYYDGLINDRLNDEDGRGIGPFADRSYVPLAQCYLLDSDQENDTRAEELLRYVVGGGLGDPGMPGYREAVLELGQLYYRAGRFAAAIEQLARAATLFDGDARIDLVRYRLADAYRLEAAAIARSLEDAMPDQDRRDLEARRRDWLRAAMELFEEVASGLERRDSRRLSAVEALALRNSQFYSGDCAFDLGDYDRAIHAYDTAKEKYLRDPAALVAMVQIANAYLEQGQLALARTANDRARRFYESLPATVWDDPDLPMTNAAWKRWLDSSARLSGADSEASEGGSDRP
jgi:tetratricopeptide (TPR) repeat protein